MEFKLWLEQLTLKQTISPDDKYKHIWVKDDKNPQQVNNWIKNNTRKIFEFPLNKDTFIHFTLKENASKIIADEVINTDPVFAISLNFGIYLPVVQYNHIISKRKQKLIQPMDLKNKDKTNIMLQKGWQIPNFGEEIVAIKFKTNIVPSRANKEEVIWNSPLLIHNISIISSREAIRMLNHTMYSKQMSGDDEVKYI